tara:strand:- start:95 stop:772 length:678 start_codon:yes stop_codon:yes gene_type:complete
MEKSPYSQLNQDLWVVQLLNNKRHGFFIDIGAHDGMNLSNTYMLETLYKWNGICIEANPDTYTLLEQNRSAKCVRALLSDTANQNIKLHKVGELSFVDNANQACTIGDIESALKAKVDKVAIRSQTLDSILNSHCIPNNTIDYLSIDIEGMEMKALSTLDFHKYHINAITIEHNACHIGTSYRDKIYNFLTSNGFEFVKGNDNVQNWDPNKYYIEDFYKNKEIRL